MQEVGRETWVAFGRGLERAQVPPLQRPDYHKWTRFYLDFCRKYDYPATSLTSRTTSGPGNRLCRRAVRIPVPEDLQAGTTVVN